MSHPLFGSLLFDKMHPQWLRPWTNFCIGLIFRLHSKQPGLGCFLTLVNQCPSEHHSASVLPCSSSQLQPQPHHGLCWPANPGDRSVLFRALLWLFSALSCRARPGQKLSPSPGSVARGQTLHSLLVCTSPYTGRAQDFGEDRTGPASPHSSQPGRQPSRPLAGLGPGTRRPRHPAPFPSKRAPALGPRAPRPAVDTCFPLSPTRKRVSSAPQPGNPATRRGLMAAPAAGSSSAGEGEGSPAPERQRRWGRGAGFRCLCPGGGGGAFNPAGAAEGPDRSIFKYTDFRWLSSICC